MCVCDSIPTPFLLLSYLSVPLPGLLSAAEVTGEKGVMEYLIEAHLHVCVLLQQLAAVDS